MVNRAWEGGRLSKSYSDIDLAVLEPSYDSFSFKNLLGAQEFGWLSGHLALSSHLVTAALGHVQERLKLTHDYNCIWKPIVSYGRWVGDLGGRGGSCVQGRGQMVVCPVKQIVKRCVWNEEFELRRISPDFIL